MTHHTAIALRHLSRATALATLLTATAAHADPGPDAIMLERIGAVRMVQPSELQQLRVPEGTPRNASPQPGRSN